MTADQVTHMRRTFITHSISWHTWFIKGVAVVRENSQISGYSTQSKIAGSGERKMMKEKETVNHHLGFRMQVTYSVHLAPRGKPKLTRRKRRRRRGSNKLVLAHRSWANGRQ
jgi:hypothetical protein